MKKSTAFSLSIIILLSLFSFTVNAENKSDNTVNLILPGYTEVNILPEYYANSTERKNMILNPYYQKYYNELLANSYDKYEKRDIPEDIDWLIEYYIKNNTEYVTLIFKGNYQSKTEISTYNQSILKDSGFSDENIIYVSDYDYAAVVRISKNDKQKLFEMEELAFIGNAFFTDSPIVMLPELGTYTLGKVVFKEGQQRYEATQVTAADARFILRYSAGLEQVGANKQFYFCADINMDNKINSQDARIALRMAADIEDEVYISYNYNQFWYDEMGELE